jgi:hypothetical protein
LVGALLRSALAAGALRKYRAAKLDLTDEIF